MSNRKVTIIGGGNIGTAIADGLIRSQEVNPENLIMTRKVGSFIEYVCNGGITQNANNRQAVVNADIVVLAIQPGQLDRVLTDIKDDLTENQYLVSIVMGVPMEHIHAVLGKNIPLFRVMPNTAIAIQVSMTLIASKYTSSDQKVEIEMLFEKMGKVMFIDEDQMLAGTILASSGIAFALRFIRAVSQGGTEIGFESKEAQIIAAQVLKGAAELLLTRGLHPEEEIDKVTTPLGVTITGLNEMANNGFSTSLIKGIKKAFNKNKR